MAATIITTEDLREFKTELLDDIKQLLQNQSGHVSKKWLKSPEVKKLLGISSGTLQNLRINGTLPYTKVGGVLYYDYEEIMNVMEKNKIHNKFWYFFGADKLHQAPECRVPAILERRPFESHAHQSVRDLVPVVEQLPLPR